MVVPELMLLVDAVVKQTRFRQRRNLILRLRNFYDVCNNSLKLVLSGPFVDVVEIGNDDVNIVVTGVYFKVIIFAGELVRADAIEEVPHGFVITEIRHNVLEKVLQILGRVMGLVVQSPPEPAAILFVKWSKDDGYQAAVFILQAVRPSCDLVKVLSVHSVVVTPGKESLDGVKDVSMVLLDP